MLVDFPPTVALAQAFLAFRPHHLGGFGRSSSLDCCLLSPFPVLVNDGTVTSRRCARPKRCDLGFAVAAC